MDPEFQNHRAPIGQLGLELVDLVVGPLPVVLGAEALDPFHHHPAVPAAVENGNVAGFGQAGPESPQIMPGLFVGLGAGDGVHLIATGVQRGGDPPDVAALARGVPALVHNNHRHLLAVGAVVQHAQPLLQGLTAGVVLLIGQALGKIHLRQLGHGNQREGVLQKGHRQRRIPAGGINGAAQGLQHLHLAPLFLLGINDVPGRAGQIGGPQVIVEHILTFLIVLVLPAVVVAHPPGSVRVGGQGLQPLFLLLAADLQKQLEHQIAVVGELALKAQHALQPPDVGLALQLAPQPLLHHLVHPAGIQKGELARLGNGLHIPVQKGVAPLLRRGGGHAGHREKPGVDVLDDPSQHAALARGAPALHQHQHRQAGGLHLQLQSFQPVTGGIQPLLAFAFLRPRGPYPGFQHVAHLSFPCPDTLPGAAADPEIARGPPFSFIIPPGGRFIPAHFSAHPTSFTPIFCQPYKNAPDGSRHPGYFVASFSSGQTR